MSDTSGVGDYQNPVKFDFAVPANLTGGARLIHGANRGLMPASALEALYEHFCASCQYGSLTVGGLFGQYQRWMGLNDADVAWLEAVGRAFAAAGGPDR